MMGSVPLAGGASRSSGARPGRPLRKAFGRLLPRAFAERSRLSLKRKTEVSTQPGSSAVIAKRTKLIVILALVGGIGPGRLAAAPRVPSSKAAEALQKLAEKQHHPGAAARQLQNLKFEVPASVKAAAAGITPEALQKAIQNRGPLATRLAMLRGRPLTENETRLLNQAHEESLRKLGVQNQEWLERVARATGLSTAQVRQIGLPSTGQLSTATQTAIARLEKQCGHPLTAGQKDQIRTAYQQWYQAAQQQQKTFAQQIARIVAVPQDLVLKLLQ